MEAFNVLLNAALKVLAQNEGKVIQAGWNLLLALLQGIRNNLPQLVTLVVDIVSKFLSTIANNLGKIITAGLSILTSLIKGVVGGYAAIITTGVEIIAKLVSTIASNIGKIATAGLSILTAFLKAIADGLGKVIKAGTDLIVNLVEGIGNAGPKIIAAAVSAMVKFMNALVKASLTLIDAGARAVINFLNGVAAAIETYAPQMRAAGLRIGVALVDGMTFGLVSKAQGLYDKVSGIMGHAMSLFHKIPGVKSPSTVTHSIGEYIIEGLVNGLDSSASDAYGAAKAASQGVIDAFNNTFQTASPSKVMIEIGRNVGQGFAQGIRGSTDDIKSAFSDLNQKLTDQMVTSREIIAKEQDKLDALRKAKKPDADAIREAQKIIAENQDILERTTAAHNTLVTTLKSEKIELIGLTNEYERISERLKGAKTALDEARKTRDEAVRGFTDQYATLPDIIKTDAQGNVIDDQVGPYLEALKNQANAVTAYQATLQQLRKLGLDDATYQKLLKEGPADQQFANQLLAGGKTAVSSLNTLDGNLQKVSKTLAVNAGKNLYQAGVDAAAGLVRGLQSKKSDIYDEMETIARGMVAALKKELKIKSPSQVFAEIGRFSMEGMAQGFSDSSQMVTDAVDLAAKDALTAMRQSMSDISSIVTDELNPQPVITPILDLTQIRSQAEELTSLTTPIPITAAASYGQASIISSQQNTAEADQAVVAPGGTSVKFEQNNYSPEALTEIEIYRQTKNQLSQLKSALAIT
jgi:hypothetical protein